jgi:MoxR-like ATPase
VTEFGEFSRAEPLDPNHRLTVNGEPTREGRNYALNDELIAAIDAALYLGRPLLVTGEPGSGKTTLGYAIAQRLRLERAYLFVTKSTSEARDLFYRYDALGRFRDVQAQQATETADYLAYQGLGAAILDAHDPAAIAHLSVGRSHGWTPPRDRCRSLVIIDEIDKAARDFPNDILVEVEKLQFDVPELTATIGGSRRVPRTPAFPDAGLRPVVVITSNAERPLPDAFLRRCVYVEARFPDRKALEDILIMSLKKRFGNGWDNEGSAAPLMARLIDSVERYRNDQAVAKKPGLAEVIDAMAVLAAPPSGRDRWHIVRSALAKTRDDRQIWDSLFHSGPQAAS